LCYLFPSLFLFQKNNTFQVAITVSVVYLDEPHNSGFKFAIRCHHCQVKIQNQFFFMRILYFPYVVYLGRFYDSPFHLCLKILSLKCFRCSENMVPVFLICFLFVCFFCGSFFERLHFLESKD
jgi:hypothetical protein